MIVGNLRYMQNAGDVEGRDKVNVMRVAVDRPEHARAVCRAIKEQFTNASPALYCVPARDNAHELAGANINMRQIRRTARGGRFSAADARANAASTPPADIAKKGESWVVSPKESGRPPIRNHLGTTQQ